MVELLVSDFVVVSELLELGSVLALKFGGTVFVDLEVGSGII